MMLLIAIMASFLLGAFSTFLYEKLTEGIIVRLNGYHLHHSLYGLIFIIVSVLLYISNADTATIFSVLAFGMGIIFQHWRSEKFVFIDKKLPDVVPLTTSKQAVEIDLMKIRFVVEVASPMELPVLSEKISIRDNRFTIRDPALSVIVARTPSTTFKGK